MAQIVKLRRSSVPGQKPTNANLQLGELALNTTDGKVYMAKSGSLGPSVEELISTNTVNTGSINITGDITGSIFTGSFKGDGSGLYNLPIQNINTASLATTGSNVFVGDQIITGSINITGTVDGVDISQFSSSVNSRLNSVTASSGGVSAIYIADEGSIQGTASYFDFIGAGISAAVNNGTASITVTATGGGGSAVQGASQTYPQTTNAVTWSIDHSINSRTPVVEIYDENYNVIIPTGIYNPGAFQTLVYFDVAQRGYAIISTGGGLTVDGANAILNQSSASSTWTFNHNLGTKYPVFNIFDSNDDIIIPQRINVVDENTAIIYFSSTRTGKAVASVGGDVVNSDSSSFSVSSSFATNANLLDGLDSLAFLQTGSFQSYTSSFSSSVATTTSGLTSTITSLSSSLTSSIGSLSSSIATTTSGLSSSIESLSSSVAITTSGLTSTITSLSSSLTSSIGSLSSSIASINNTQNGRLDSLETESGSIRSNFNTFTSSYTTGAFTGSFKGDGSQLYNIPASGVTGLNLNKIISGSVSASISPNRGLEINTDVYIDGALTAKELFINYVTSSVLYESGSTKFGDTLDDTHEFTGSVNITGSISLNGQPIGTGKLDEVTFNLFTSSYTTGAFTGSFIGDGSQLTNIPASGVTGLNLNKIVSGSVSASISPDRGLEINTDTTISGSLQISGSGFLNSHRILTDLDTGSMGLINSIQFNTSSNISVKPGELAWNNTDGTLDLGMKGGNVVQQIGQEIFYEVRNETGIQIPNGTAVYANGVTAGSGRITAAPYVADGSIRENRFLGIVTENISTGVNGFVTYFGYVRGLDTRGTTSSSIAVGDETWAVGDILYVHPTVAGKLTKVKPQHEVTTAIIITRHQSSGVIFVRPSSAGHLEDIHDISINTGSLTNGQVLVYNSTNGLWENTNTISGSLNVTGGLTGSIDFSNITNIPTLVSGSSQISYTGITNIPSGIVSGSEQLTGSYDTRYVLSGSITQTTWDNIASKPSGIVSGSSQIIGLGFATTGSFLTTGSNSLVGNQNINGNLSVTGSVVISGSLDLSNANVGNSRYLHTQGSSSTTWNIVHNLNYLYPNITVYDGDDKIMLPDEVTSIDLNTTQVTFAIAESGHALASVGGISPNAADRYLHTQTSATGSWVIDHNIGYKYVTVNVYDNNDEQLVPLKISAVSANRTQIDFSLPTSGNATITVGGPRVTTTSLFSQTGSYYNATTNIGITGSLVVTGDVDADNFNTTSDRKLKTNLVRIEGALDKIEKLNGYTFDWLEEYSEDRSRQIGMVADEVYEVQPELISHRNIVLSNKEEKIKLLDYSKVTAILIEAIKELNNKITKLENKKKKK